ncbi:MAG: DUF3667 domain-containing protein [Puniceicoccaceae bacterium]
MSAETDQERCRNCGTELQGDFCHQCGQSSKVIRRPTREVLDDALGNVFHWDSRLFRTLRLLFFHPGRLSAEWVEGRRMRYVPPFRLYIIASFVLFLLVGLSTRQSSDDFQAFSASDNAIKSLQASIDKAKEAGDWLEGIILQATLQAIQDPAAYFRKITSNLPKAAFVFLPLFALLHRLANLRQKRFYIDYLVFSLNFHAFSFLLIAIVLLAGLLSSFVGEFLELFYPLILVYGIIAFRNFSQQGWGKSILKGFLVFGAYATVLSFGIAFYLAAVLFL